LQEPVIILGAGLASLSCARALAEGGVPARLVERSRGVGGRCATRRVDGQPVDHGLAFLHGRDARFLAAARAVEGGPRPWPLRVRGEGTPCNARAFAPGEVRFVYPQGVHALPKSLAAGLQLRTQSPVVRLERSGGRFELLLESGERLGTQRLVVAAAVEQTSALLAPLVPAVPALRGTLALLESLGSVACIALLAGYPRGAGALDWDLWYPAGSKLLQLVSHDSAKRIAPALDVLVLQSRPAWSREHLEDGEERWRALFLEEAARLLGAWAGAPLWSQLHRWRYARTRAGAGLAGPILHRVEGGWLGLAGEAFSPEGGAEGAFLSGLELARSILQS